MPKARMLKMSLIVLIAAIAIVAAITFMQFWRARQESAKRARVAAALEQMRRMAAIYAQQSSAFDANDFIKRGPMPLRVPPLPPPAAESQESH